MIVPTVNGVGPDGHPFEAGVALDSRYTTDFASWVKELVESGGATNTDPTPSAEVLTDRAAERRAARARRRGSEPAAVVDATATLARDQEVQG